MWAENVGGEKDLYSRQTKTKAADFYLFADAAPSITGAPSWCILYNDGTK